MAHAEGRIAEQHLVVLDLRHVQDAVEQIEQVQRRRVHLVQAIDAPLVALLGLQGYLGHADDAVHGRADLVRHARKEVGLRPRRLVELLLVDAVLDDRAHLAQGARGLIVVEGLARVAQEEHGPRVFPPVHHGERDAVGVSARLGGHGEDGHLAHGMHKALLAESLQRVDGLPRKREHGALVDARDGAEEIAHRCRLIVFLERRDEQVGHVELFVQPPHKQVHARRQRKAPIEQVQRQSGQGHVLDMAERGYGVERLRPVCVIHGRLPASANRTMAHRRLKRRSRSAKQLVRAPYVA